MRALAIALLLIASPAFADDGAAFRDATQRALAGDLRAIDELEAIGAAQPPSRWSDDAWSEAARFAERAGDRARARRDLERVLAIGTDAALVARARLALARLGAARWDEVARAHARLVEEASAGSDPHAPLTALEALAAAHPAYPRASALAVAIASGWEREGETARALRWFRQSGDRLALARAAIRMDALDEAARVLDDLAAHDPTAVADARRALATARTRQTVAHAVLAALVGLLVAQLALARRAAGSWRAFARPPTEAWFFAPLALVLVVVAQTGNPLAASAVTMIVVGGLAVAYVAGVGLAAARSRRRLALHGGLAIVTVAALAYLALDRYRLLDLLRETVVSR